MSQHTTKAKLPVWSTVGGAYCLAFENLGQIVRISWVWLIVVTVLSFALNWFTWPFEQEAREGGDWQQLSFWLLLPLTFLAGASVAVAWHRLLLQRSGVAAIGYLRLDSVVLRYVGYLALFFSPILVWTYVLEAQIFNSAPETNWWVAGFFLVTLICWSIYFWIGTRFAMVLPAIAIGREDITPGASWRATAGNFWRIMWGSFLVFLPFIVVAVPLAYLPDPTTRVQSAAYGSMWDAIGLLLGIVAVGFLSLAFRHLVPESTAARSDPPRE